VLILHQMRLLARPPAPDAAEVIFPGPEGHQGDPAIDPPIWEGTDATTRFIRRARRRPTAMLGTVLALCLLGGTVGWVSGAPSRIEEALHLRDSSQAPSADDPGPGGDAETRQDPPTDHRGSGPAPCRSPLSVVAAQDIAAVVQELAEPLVEGACPRVTVTGQDPAGTLAMLAGGGTAPDVWIPDSTLWLRLAASGGGETYPTTGTSVARTPVVVAVPQRVHEGIGGPDVLPAWAVLVDKVINGGIPRMSMPSRDSAAGALALVSLNRAMLTSSGGDGTAAYLRQTHFRNTLASTDADVDDLLHALAGTTPERAGTEVGAFPATEQQLLAYHEADPAVPVVVVGTYDASIEADYPMVVSRHLDEREDPIADELLRRLRSSSAVQRLVDLGFRPPLDEPTSPPALADTGRFPDYPAPIPLPDVAGWRDLVHGWTLAV
jgi:Bacterial extracellular solute-binding protein